MHFKVHFHVILLCIFFLYMHTTVALPCDSCGNECTNACGTKHFRTCCFNYLRKRTDPNAMKFITNKRLIDYIMLQGHGRAMLTQNELSRENDDERLKQDARRNGTLMDQGVQSAADSSPSSSSSAYYG